jgi:peroxiredoxin
LGGGLLPGRKSYRHPWVYFVCCFDTIDISQEAGMPKEGSKAPDFSLPDDHGNKVCLSDFKGRKTVVLFFYPKADTPG